MRIVLRFWPVLSLLLSGCASMPIIHSSANHERAEVEQRLQQIIDAACKKDFARLESYHFYGPQFTKFPAGTLGRENAEAARTAERNGLSALNDLSMKADELKVDIFGSTAVATFIMDSTFNTGGTPLHHQSRATLVLVKDKGAWKIAHEHFSEFKTPL